MGCGEEILKIIFSKSSDHRTDFMGKAMGPKLDSDSAGTVESLVRGDADDADAADARPVAAEISLLDGAGAGNPTALPFSMRSFGFGLLNLI